MNVSSATNEDTVEKEEEKQVEEEEVNEKVKSKNTCDAEREQQRENLQRAIDDTESALVPVRAHGLAVMRRAISNRTNRDVVESMYQNLIKCILIKQFKNLC